MMDSARSLPYLDGLEGPIPISGLESAGWTVVPSRVVASRHGGYSSPRVRFAVAPCTLVTVGFQHGPQQSRARGFCAAERTLDGEDRSGTWEDRGLAPASEATNSRDR